MCERIGSLCKKYLVNCDVNYTISFYHTTFLYQIKMLLLSLSFLAIYVFPPVADRVISFIECETRKRAVV